jgi:aryl-alcohol dehydrogenase-like predicted oxidoreductase
MSGARPARTRLPLPTDRLPLGDSGLRVSPFCLGRVREEETILAAFDAGINFFFVTADLHWPFYEQTRRGLQRLLARGGAVREQVVVGICSYCTQPDLPPVALWEAVNAIDGLSSLDLAIAGAAHGHEYLERYRTFERIRREKYLGARAIGTTFHDRKAAAAATSHNLVDIALVRYNPIHRGAWVDLFPYLDQPTRTLLYSFTSTLGYFVEQRRAELDLPDVGWQPTVGDFYRFALARPELDGLLIGLDTPEQVAAFVRTLESGPLDPAQERDLLALGPHYLAALRSGSVSQPAAGTMPALSG